MSVLFDASAHTAHHGKDENTGRSPEIESYIEKSVDYALTAYLENLPLIGKDPADLETKTFTMVDLGSDYGYALHYAREKMVLKAQDVHLVGVDPYFENNPFNLNLLREEMDDTYNFTKRIGMNGKVADLIILNHTLEHVANAHKVAENIVSISGPETVVFIAVPDAQSEWSRWDGHYTIWTKDWLQHFMFLHGFVPVKPVELRCFRGDNVEVWGAFRLKRA